MKHPSSIISKNAEIDENVEIGPFCVIEGKVKIGKGTKIFNNVTIFSGAVIGENNTIFPGAVLAGLPQDLKFGGEFTELIIGDDNIIRECVSLNRATLARRKTVIGSKNLFMAYSHVSHDSIVGSNCVFANSVGLGGHVEIGDYVILGGLTGIHQFVKIGAHAMIGAASMVVKDVVPYSLFSGNPLSYEGLNIIGLRRRGFGDEKIGILKETFKYLFKSGLNVTQAVAQIKSSIKITGEVENLLSFISGSSRGIAK
jgi:UDP-N-acetylglucosamine acyltransferase